MQAAFSPGNSALRWTLGLLVPLVFVAVLRTAPPPAKPATAPPDEFSAGRAREALRALSGVSVPHPVGSAANAQLREAITDHLRRLGYTPEVQRAFSCNANGTCATVHNIVALLPGREAGPAVLLSCHYDSVAAGPGAGDDGAGVAAVLEIARILKAEPPPRHGIILLIDDGEEAGLLGALAFTQQPLMAQVHAVVNLEARGTTGPSLLFETSHDNAWLIRALAGRLSRPKTSSLFATVYERLPNDTDLTVFKAGGVAGVNFAFIGGAARYHTAVDDLAHLDPATLQHQGDNALATVRALADADLAHPPPGRAVFFDVLGLIVLWWPEPWTLGLALLAVALVAAGAARWRKAGAVTGHGIAWGGLAGLTMVAMTALAAVGLRRLLAGTGGLPADRAWVAHPAAALAAFGLLGLALPTVVLGLFARRTRPAELWLSVWTTWAVLGLALAITAPGLSYLFIVPVLLAGGVTLGGLPRPWLAALPVAAAAVLGLPLVLLLYDALGTAILPLCSALVAPQWATVAPALLGAQRSRRWIGAVTASAALLCAVAAALQPAASPDSPVQMGLTHYDDGARTRWLVGTDAELPAALRAAAPFGAKREWPFPWSQRITAFSAAAPRSLAAPPELEVLAQTSDGGARHLRAVLRSRRRAARVSLILPPQSGVREVRIGGQALPPAATTRFPRSGWRVFTCLSAPPEGVSIELTLGAAPVQGAIVEDRTPGLPPETAALVQARPATAAPGRDGDVSIVSRSMTL